MITRNLIVSGLALLASACAPKPMLYEIEVLDPNPFKLVALPPLPGDAANQKKADGEEKPLGHWFARRIYKPFEGSRRLDALEIVWCSVDQKCTTALAWERAGRAGYGSIQRRTPPATAPASPPPAADDATAPDPAPAPAPAPAPEAAPAPAPATAPAPAASAAPTLAPAPGVPADAIRTNSVEFAQIPGPTIVSIRRLVGQDVTLFKSDGNVDGKLDAIDAKGIKLAGAVVPWPSVVALKKK